MTPGLHPNGRRRKRGQTLEILNFLALAVVIVAVILIMRTMILKSSVAVGERSVEWHQSESFKSGANALLFMTEEKSGKTFMELMSLVSSTGSENLTLGTPDNPITINVTEDLVDRLNKLFGEGKWRIEIPLHFTSVIETVIVTDVSGSMCDDVNDIIRELPQMTAGIRRSGKNVKITMYLLPGQGSCPAGYKPLKCSSFPSTDPDIFQCKPLMSASCNLAGGNEEDWGNGLKCVIESESSDWNKDAVLVGMVMSDELPTGCECGGGGCSSYRGGGAGNACWNGGYMSSDAGCVTQKRSLQNGIDAAKKVDMVVFPLKGNPCATPNAQCGNRPLYVCAGDRYLEQYMQKMADETGGMMFDLKDSSKTAETITKIIEEQKGRPKPPIVLGNIPEFRKRIWSYEIPIPVYSPGEFVMVKLKWWT